MSVIFRLIFSLFVFVLCLGLVEVFFIFNEKFNFLHPKEPKPNLQEVLKYASPPPQDLVKKIESDYSNFVAPNSDFQGSSQIIMKNIRWNLNAFPSDIISRKKYQSENILSIYDTKTNPVLNRLIYKSNYNFYNNRTRLIPGQKFSQHKKNILLVGCSYVFGMGVNDNQTIAYFLKQKFPNYNIYNLGIPAGGMSDFIDDALIYKRLKELNNLGGIVVYYFHVEHFERTFCSLECYRPERIGWSTDKTHYDFNQNGDLVSFGSYKNSFPLRFKLFPILAKSKFLNFIGFDHPKNYGDDYQDKYVQMLKFLQKHYSEKKLDFLIFSELHGSGALQENFYKKLEAANLHYALYGWSGSDFFSRNATIIGDNHFNEVGNNYVAGLIANTLKKQGY